MRRSPVNIKFHNLDFSEKERIIIHEYVASRTFDPVDVLQTSVEMGVKVSLSYDDYHQTTRLSLTPSIEEHAFYGYVVVIRHTEINFLLGILYWLLADGFDQISPPTTNGKRYSW